MLNDINAKTYETGEDGTLRLKVQCTAVFGERVYIRLNGGSREFIALNSTAFTGENSADLDFEHSNVAQQDNLKQNLAQQNFAEQNSTAQNSMRQNLALQNVKSQNLTKQNSVEWNFVAENPTTRNLASQNSILQNFTEQNSEAQDFTAKNFTDQNSSQQNSAARDFTTQSLAPANSKVKTGEYFARTNGEAFTLSLGAGDFELGCLDENANFAKANFRVNERK